MEPEEWTADTEPGKEGYPYGIIPRLLLFWMTSEVVWKKNAKIEEEEKRKLYLGESLSEFMREVGLDVSRDGKHSAAKRVRNQMQRVFKARISFEEGLKAGSERGQRWLSMEVAPKSELWWDPKRPDQAVLWKSWIELGEDFYQALVNNPVPVDMRALRALKSSTLALDLYAWSKYRAFTVRRKGKPQFVPWWKLMMQMGSDYGDVKNFKRKAGEALRRAQAVDTELRRIEKVDGGLQIFVDASAEPRPGATVT